ncbi:glycosyltransferase family 2 protein [Rhodoferax sp. GW822-FHT02A01]|uniref:glycosyltransferase family 2 protein n=1 Tax=Rhodoferax sp. GW822-FHT02A01 TaxID=3141537 RepID=UPI00315DB36D
MNSISVLILTKNEQQDLPGCLASVAWSDDVHVLDSHSTDDTLQIAQSAGASTTLRVFDGYASQRNAGLQLAFKYPWVLIVDADERIPEPLVSEMQAFVDSASPATAAARMQRRDIWWGTWLRHAQISPYFVRLVRVGRARYEREVNEVLVVDGAIHDLRHTFDHYPFSKGLDHWIAKHNVYSRMEAQVIASGNGVEPTWGKALFGKDFNERRVHQKAIFYRLPGRPLIKFLYMLLARRAFLDGAAGMRYATLQAIYEYMIVLKVKELRHAALSVPPVLSP